MTADPHAPPPVATLVARHDSGAPRRYPALGAGLVGGFAVLSVVLTLLHGRGPIASTFAPQSEEVDATANDLKALPRAAQRSLVLIGRHAHKLQCVTQAQANQDACAATAAAAAIRIPAIIEADLSQYFRTRATPEVRNALTEAQFVAKGAERVVTILHAAPSVRSPEEKAAMGKLGERARTLAAHIDVLLHLNDPSWGPDEDAPGEAGRAAPPPAAVPGGPASAGAVTAAATPPAAAPGASPPSAAAPSAVAHSTAPPPAATNATDGGAPRDTKDVAKDLVRTLHEVLAFLTKCGHDPSLVSEAVYRSRRRLESMDTTFQDYEKTPRPPDVAADAKAFAQQVDQARGRLQRTATELDRATKNTAGGVDGERPFGKADDLLARAREDVTAAEALVADAP